MGHGIDYCRSKSFVISRNSFKKICRYTYGAYLKDDLALAIRI